MASLIKGNRRNPGWRIEFKPPLGWRRKTITISKDVPERKARHFVSMLEQLIAARHAGYQPDPAVAAWLGALSPVYREQIAKTGLIDSETRLVMTMGDLVAGWLASRKNIAPRTMANYQGRSNYFLDHFGASCPISTITPDAAEKSVKAIKGAKATASLSVTVAKMMFRHAVEIGALQSNPFAKIIGGGTSNRLRAAYISEDAARQVLAKIEKRAMRIVFVMSRWGGVRVPSETEPMRWKDFDFARKRITVHSPKTARHAGGESRVIPLFPEIAAELGEPGDSDARVCKISRTNISQHVIDAAELAGLPRWPRLLHNLRASRATDLEARFGVHVAARWLGHSPGTALAHYLQTTEADFAKAISPP